MLRTLLANLSDVSLSALRVVSGLMFAQHGAQKLFGVLGGQVKEIDSRFFPVVNKGELGLLYCFVFLFIACKSAGSAGAPRAKSKR